MSSTEEPKPWFEDAAALLKQRHTGESADAHETERRIVSALQKRPRVPRFWWMVPGVVVATGSLAFAKDAYDWTVRQVQEVLATVTGSQASDVGSSPSPAARRRGESNDTLAPATAAPSHTNGESPASAPALEPPADATLAPATESNVAPSPPDGEKHPSQERRDSARHSTQSARAQAATPSPPSDLELYRAGYQAQYQSKDYVAALAAWDDYLAHAPRGLLMPEVRWHRALTLVELGRRDQAKRALEPFASGAYGTHRQRDAVRLLERLGE